MQFKCITMHINYKYVDMPAFDLRAQPKYKYNAIQIHCTSSQIQIDMSDLDFWAKYN